MGLTSRVSTGRWRVDLDAVVAVENTTDQVEGSPDRGRGITVLYLAGGQILTLNPTESKHMESFLEAHGWDVAALRDDATD